MPLERSVPPDLVEPDDRESLAAAVRNVCNEWVREHGVGPSSDWHVQRLLPLADRLEAGAVAGADRQSAAIRQELADMAEVAYRGNEREKVLEAQVRALTDALGKAEQALRRAGMALLHASDDAATSLAFDAADAARAALPVPDEAGDEIVDDAPIKGYRPLDTPKFTNEQKAEARAKLAQNSAKRIPVEREVDR